MSKGDEDAAEYEHGIEAACYVRNATGLVPTLFCLCGWSTYPTGATWEEAGAELDAHLEGSGAASAR